LTGQIRLGEPTAFVAPSRCPPPHPPYGRLLPIGEKERGLRFETEMNSRVGQGQLFTAPASHSRNWAGTQDRSGDRRDGERITNIEPGPLSKEPEGITERPNLKAAKDYNCPNGSFFDARGRRLVKSTAYIRVWRGARAVSKRGQAPLCQAPFGPVSKRGQAPLC
jgi:hypothetical protein